jgi:hypothetical protein
LSGQVRAAEAIADEFGIGHATAAALPALRDA